MTLQLFKYGGFGAQALMRGSILWRHESPGPYLSLEPLGRKEKNFRRRDEFENLFFLHRLGLEILCNKWFCAIKKKIQAFVTCFSRV